MRFLLLGSRADLREVPRGRFFAGRMHARIGVLRALHHEKPTPDVTPPRKEGRHTLQDGPMTTVWIYVDTSRQVGDLDHLKVFVDEATANTWLAENDPEGMAFEYEVFE